MVHLRTFKIFALVLLAAAFAVASSVVEDSRSRFVLEDEVIDATVYDCVDEQGNLLDGSRFEPENAVYADGNALPYRVYRVAIPGNAAPSVSVSNVKTKILGASFCKDAKIAFSSVQVSNPFLKDGLWMVDIKVPLYTGSGKGIQLRKQFKLAVNFNSSAQGTNPGARAVSQVANPKAAALFGVNRSAALKALRRSSNSETSDVQFLAQFVVGDKNVATTSEDGLYAIEFKTIRNALMAYNRQSEIDGLPVDKICLFGAKPDTLLESGPGTAERSPNHLFEIPVEIRDHSKNSSEADGIFGDGDSIIFVGYGNGFWKRCDLEQRGFNTGKMDYFYVHSPFSFYQYFQFGYKESGKGMRLSDKIPGRSGTGKKQEWMRYLRAEKEMALIDAYYGKDLDWEKATGKEWFWLWHARNETADIDASTLLMPHVVDFAGRINGGREYVSVSYIPYRSVWSGSADFADDQVSNLELSAESYETRMSGMNFEFSVNGKSFKSSKLELIPGGNFRIDNPGFKDKGNSYSLKMLPNDVQYDRFDGYSVAYQWNPVVDSAEWLLPGKTSGLISVPVPKNTQVMKFLDFKPVGLLTVNGDFVVDSVNGNTDVRYLAYKPDVFRTAVTVECLPAKPSGVLGDISRINSKTDYLIIAPQEFLRAAVALAEFRSSGDAPKTFGTSVVSVEDIYRQYTGGALSPVAIRNYIAYARSVCPNLKYVLLGGSGHYDYRGFDSKLKKNFMPPYEREDAVTEDYFAVLDSGEMIRYGEYDLDLAVGRLPVSSEAEFFSYVEKAKDYEKKDVADFSNWRSNILLAADDAKNGNSIDRTRHTNLQESVANSIDSLYEKIGFRYNLKKIYLLNYAYDAAGQKKDAAADFLNVLNQGALFTTYFGHGSMTDWAAEGLLKPSYIPKLSNKGRYTILNSFSCTVARFDQGRTKSLSEEFLLANSVGAIASVGAARETFASYNVALGKSFMLNALSVNGETIGDAFMKAKNPFSSEYSRQRYNNEHYLLIGEPVIKMPAADLKIRLDQKLSTIKALDKMRLSGTVSSMDDGFINIQLREGRVGKRMFIGLEDEEDDSLDVVYDGNMIYSEEVPVVGGRFDVEFVTPQKMAFGDSAAEFSAWAYSRKNNKIGRLFQNQLIISGFSTYADSIHDETPPSISVESCYSGGIATSFNEGQPLKMQSPACLRFVIEDSTALDFREQADEGISLEIVGLESPYHPFPYMEQTSKRAVFRKEFTSEKYPDGKYEVRIRAMDVLGNMDTKTVVLEITSDMKEGVMDVFNVPNPVGKKGTTFYFKNLSANRSSTVDIFIYNQKGRIVKVLRNAEPGVTHWDGRDNHGRPLANGLYYYVVRSEVAGNDEFKKQTFTKKQKLLISR